MRGPGSRLRETEVRLCRDYGRAGLAETDVDPDPIGQFERWFEEAARAGMLNFHSRPPESQVGAWASQPSAVLPDRHALEKRVRELTDKYRDQTSPVPPFWGGYRVVPSTMEFWQGRPGRLHDPLRYSRESDGTWRVVRLSP